MHLTRDEEKGLSGEYGEATSTAYRILVAIGEATDAEKLYPSNGHMFQELTTILSEIVD